MIQLKLCMVGSFAVGKTSLVKQYVQSLFSDKYHTTVGVKVDKKEVILNGQTVARLMIWDLAGDDEFSRLQTSFLRGSAGYVLVADGTRAATLDIALELKRQIALTQGDVPCVLVLNKQDRCKEWEIDEARVANLQRGGLTVFRCSAKDGSGVEAIFQYFATLSNAACAS